MPEAPPDQRSIAADLTCKACGFNLIGLSPVGICPECGQPVQRSLRGNLLWFSSARHVAALQRGAVLAQAAVVVLVGGLLLSVLLAAAGPRGWRWPGEVIRGTWALAAAVNAAGWWLLAAPEPGELDTAEGARERRVARAAAVVGGVAVIAVVLAGVPRPGALAARGLLSAPFLWGAAVWGGVLAAYSAWFFTGMWYARRLALRIPSERALERAGLLRWLGPILCTGGLLLCGLGPYLALGLYYDLVGGLRKDLSRAQRERAATAGPPR